ncbi:hypothetical protein B0H14DRAFT_3423532 [Mycena olivaceomarginata]|nr:hypothetical protein B0H14DRAFT_3423532 [Mycena olivaceomarginata]
MPPKRKSDLSTPELEAETSFDENDSGEYLPTSKAKKARVDAASSSSSEGKVKTEESDSEDYLPATKTKKARVDTASSKGKAKTKDIVRWQDVELEKNADGSGVPVYDLPGDIRRKIRALLSTPGFKITYWLEEIGRSTLTLTIVSAKDKYDGASNGTYYSAYVYFEKVRIAQGKPKSAGRRKNEKENPKGFLAY